MTTGADGDEAAAVPVVVIGGYLGAGKTTLVNHLLRHAEGRRIAVLVNDFGEISIDAGLIEGATGEVLALAGGCICCSYGADLIGTLQRLLQREPRPQQLLIECSGVGLPAAVARSARLVRGLQVDGVVVLLDAESVQTQAGDAYVGDTVCQQIADADLLVLNKVDLCGAAQRAGLRGWLAAAWPATPCVDAVQAALPGALLFGPASPEPSGDGAAAWPARPIRAPAKAAGDRFVHERRRFEQPVDVAGIVDELRAVDAGVLRAKGWLDALDGRRYLVQLVGRRVDIVALPAGTPASATGELVIIRRAGANATQPA